MSLTTASGTIVYVAGASDRKAGVEDHTRRIRESLKARGSDFEVIAADWGDAVGPRLDDILKAVPGTASRTGYELAATEERGPGRLLQGVAAGIVALQYLNVRAPGFLRVWATDVLLRRRDALTLETLGIADILVYQRAGQSIRDHVKGMLRRDAGDDRPLIALGNSLGGVILVDALASRMRPGPTSWSQRAPSRPCFISSARWATTHHRCSCRGSTSTTGATSWPSSRSRSGPTPRV